MPLLRLFYCLTLSATCLAQSAEQTVYSSSGNHVSNGDVQVSYTIGEALITTESNASTTAAQGFHQSNLSVADLPEISIFEMSIYPNPTVDILNVDFDSKEELTFMLYDGNGRLISINKSIFSFELYFEGMSTGIYYLHVSDKSQKKETFTITKTR